MTASFLQSELSSLIADSKRKNNDVRAAAEHALTEIKSISVTSETQLASDLIRRLQFIDPFILACKSKNAKLAGSGTICLQRLTASRAIPPNRLKDVLDAFQDVVGIGFDTQLKILQTLPSLLQLYPWELHGPLLATTLELCATLEASKVVVINKTAAATFQQLFTTVFKQADHYQRRGDAREATVNPEHAQNEDRLTEIIEDAEKLFLDLCLLMNQKKPKFLNVESLSTNLLLEIVNLTLEDQNSFLVERDVTKVLLREEMMQGVLNLLSSKDQFASMVRLLRIVKSLTRRYSDGAEAQLQPIICHLLNLLDRDTGLIWKRALCLEFFQYACSDFGLLRHLFEIYDLKDGMKKIISELMASLVRIAAEDPSLIGLGRQSTIPTLRNGNMKEDDIAAIEAQGIGGGLASVTSADTNATGISLEWSTLDMPLIDHLDLKAPPTIPSTYIYTLILGCISSFSDGLSKHIMPLSVSGRRQTQDGTSNPSEEEAEIDNRDREVTKRPKRALSSAADKYQRLINPLALSKHPRFSEVETCSKMIDRCWPAVLATCSTFLNAALDSNFYHVLIRSVQKLAQVSGVFDLSTPRDALLTSLAKASVPPNINMLVAHLQNDKATPQSHSALGGKLESPSLRSPVMDTPKQSFDWNRQSLNIRHLLCLRALLNLGIALGPSLTQDSWFIIIETLQQVDSLISITSASNLNVTLTNAKLGQSGSDGHTTLGAEMNAMQVATRRMIESSRSYANDSFQNLVGALFKLIGTLSSEEGLEPATEVVSSPAALTRPEPRNRMHSTSRSVSGLWSKTRTLDLELDFVLIKVSDLARINLHRFATVSSFPVSWDLIVTKLLSLVKDLSLAESFRLRAASVIDIVSMETVKLLDSSHYSADAINFVHAKCLEALLVQLEEVALSKSYVSENIHIAHMEMQKRILEALEDIISHCGDSLGKAWSTVFEILDLTCRVEEEKANGENINRSNLSNGPDAVMLTAFKCVHLIASDFLTILDNQSFGRLTCLFYVFGTQSIDINVALTTTNLLRSLASLLLERCRFLALSENTFVNATAEDFAGEAIEDEITLLWALNLSQLVRICKDPRADVRNAAVKVLTQVLDSASDAFTKDSWHFVLMEAPISILMFYQKVLFESEEYDSDWSASSLHLLQDTVKILTQHIQTIAASSHFIMTWEALIEALEAMLRIKQRSHSLIFTSLSDLLEALTQIRPLDPRFVNLALEIWSKYHPAIIFTEPSANLDVNEKDLAAHAHVLVMAYQASQDSVRRFSYNSQSISELVISSVKRTLLAAIHSPYASDIRRLAPEQQEIKLTLPILKELLDASLSKYTKFILDLVQMAVLTNKGEGDNDEEGKFQAQIFVGSKNLQKPTFIAFVLFCVETVNDLAKDLSKKKSFLENLAVDHALDILLALITTKHTDFPLNSDQPLWRTSTMTAVNLVEITKLHVKSKDSIGDNGMLDRIGIAIGLTVSRILQSGGLETHKPIPEDSTVLDDESFDIEQFNRFHAAAMSILGHSQVTELTRKHYVVDLFESSLIAKSWFNDFPEDLLRDPFDQFRVLRPGSVHKPVFPRRLKICYAALQALFNLVRSPTQTNHGKQDYQRRTSPQMKSDQISLASTALPYLILRIAHPIKIFLTDQRLRGLTPPPMNQQVELHHILNMSLNLRCASEGLLPSPESTISTNSWRPAVQRNNEDGKLHLRYLYPLILQLQTLWLHKLPRLKGAAAWQSGEHGIGIEKAILKWSEVVSEGWGYQAPEDDRLDYEQL